MKHNSRNSRIFTVIASVLMVGTVTATLAGGRQASSIPRVQLPSGPVARELALARNQPAPYELQETGGTSQRIDACVQTFMRAYGIPGASIAIIDNGSLVYEKGYGVKHREQGGNVTPGPVFRFGSTLKMMLGPLLGVFTASYLDDPKTHVLSNFIRNRSFVLIREGATGPRR